MTAGLDAFSTAVNAWMVFMLCVSVMVVLVSGIAILAADQRSAHRKRQWLHEARWVGREQPGAVAVWRIGPSVEALDRDTAGLAWGWAGASTERLAELILREVVREAEARRLARPFASEVLAFLPESGFILCESEVRAWLQRRSHAPREYLARLGVAARSARPR